MTLPKNLYLHIHDRFLSQPTWLSVAPKANWPVDPSASRGLHSKDPPLAIVWKNVAIFTILHIWALYGLYVINWRTFVCFAVFGSMSALGVTAAAHRFWSHRSFKAKLPLRTLLMIFQTITIQNDIYVWSRDHRLHHKYTETNADPHNSKRGFFFSHMGWLMVKKHPDVMKKGKTIDMSDVLSDPVVQFQRRHYYLLVIIFSVLLPSIGPVILWQEDFWDSLSTCFFFRYVVCLHMTWIINSVAHMYGDKPYDKFISPSDSTLMSAITYGGGFHNFHHTFPCDYASSEYGWKYNVTAMFINFMAWLGQAYDLKRVSDDIIQKRRKRTGTPCKEN